MLILQGPKQLVEGLTFSPDAAKLYVIQGHHGIREWNLLDRTATRVEFGGRLVKEQFVFYPGGRWAFSSTAHAAPNECGGGRVIDLVAGAMRPFNLFACSRTSIAFPAGAVNIVTIGNSYLDLERPTEIMQSTDRLYGWTMTPSGPRYAWHRDIPRNEPVLTLVALGDRLATAEQVYEPGAGEAESPGRPRVTIRRASDGGPERQLPFPGQRVQQLFASPCGDLLVGSDGAELYVRNEAGWVASPVAVEGRHKFITQSAAAFHPSGRYFFLTHNNAQVSAFDTTTWRVVQKWTWKAGALRAVAVSPDGLLAAAGSAEGTVVVWDLDL